MSSSHAPKLRSLYRQILRELPSRSSQPRETLLSHPSPIQQRLRNSFADQAAKSGAPIGSIIQETEQFVQYAKAQRMYATLIERYNPGMGMDEEERVRLTARKVGMDLPVEFKK